MDADNLEPWATDGKASADKTGEDVTEKYRRKDGTKK